MQPFDLDAEYRRLTLMEKDCHNAARAMAKAMIEMLDTRESTQRHVELERTIFEVASDRARAGLPLEEETDKQQGDVFWFSFHLIPPGLLFCGVPLVQMMATKKWTIFCHSCSLPRLLILPIRPKKRPARQTVTAALLLRSVFSSA
jgi:hypothetical protein